MNEPLAEIERLEAPSREDFERRWVERNRPVILTGVATTWPALERWSPGYLRSVAGTTPVIAHYQREGDFHEWYQDLARREDRELPLSELLDRLTSEPPERRLYMTEHELAAVSPELVADVDASAYLDEPLPMLFMGRDAFMPLHYHGGTEALLCQLRGSKRVTLYSPDQFRNLYPRPWWGNAPVFSRVDVREPDLERFPRFARSRPLELCLEPGEILYIPVHWWHATRVDAFQISVTFFWRAALRCYTFPSPGLQWLLRRWLGVPRLLHAADVLRRRWRAPGVASSPS